MAYPGLIEGEAWAMEVARSAARCASSALIDLEEAPASLVVRRFDRTIVDGTVKRVHQEDCCQALGLPPTNKYADAVRQKGDDPTYARIAAILAQYADDPLAEADELLRQIVVNLVLGNVDAHAKNYSLLHVQPFVVELSPMYDVVPVRDIEPRAHHLSLRVMGKILADDITREDVIGEACSWGMGRGHAVQVIDETLARMESGIAQANTLYPKAGQRHTVPTYERIRQLV
jgi:serine/threonine-protein kinase HipA